MIYKIDNRPNRNKNKYIVLGIFLGIILTIGGFYVYDNYKSTIIQNVNLIKDATISQIPKAESQNTYVNTNQNSPQTSNNIPPQDNQPVAQVSDNTESQTNTSIDVSTLEHQIHDQINIQREQVGLKQLSYDKALAKVARDHSQDMATNNYFDHDSPSGETMESRIHNAKIPCWAMGENIEQSNISTPNLLDSIIQTWMDSSGHRENILRSLFMREGIGVSVSGDNIFITEDFC